MQIKNVVIINDFNYVQGGASKVAIDTAQLLKKENINVYFFYAVNSEKDKIKYVNYISTNQNEAMKEKNKLKGLINGIYNLKAKKELKKLLLTLDKENTIIHIHGWTKALSSSVFDIIFKMKFKVVLTLHDYFTACPNGGYFNYKKNKICTLKPMSWKCINCNCDSRNYMFKIYRLIREFVQNKIVKLNKKLSYAIGISDLNINILKDNFNDNIIIKKIYNPIQFSRNTNMIDISKNDTYIYIGRVSKEKGIEIYCKAVQDLHLNGIVIGDGDEIDRLKKQYPNIIFTGWKSREEIRKYLRKAKCLIFPSLWYEGAPLTPLECLCEGIPSIVNGCSAAKEYIISDSFGYVYSNYEDLLDKIKLISSNKKMDIEEVQKYLNKFSYSNYVTELINFYNNMGTNYERKTN